MLLCFQELRSEIAYLCGCCSLPQKQSTKIGYANMQCHTCLPLLGRPWSRFTFFVREYNQLEQHFKMLRVVTQQRFTGRFPNLQFTSIYKMHYEFCEVKRVLWTFFLPLSKTLCAGRFWDYRLNKWSDYPSVSLLLWACSAANCLLPLCQQKRVAAPPTGSHGPTTFSATFVCARNEEQANAFPMIIEWCDDDRSWWCWRWSMMIIDDNRMRMRIDDHRMMMIHAGDDRC